MIVAASAFWLGLYGAIVSTVVAVAALYNETFRRIKVGANEDYLVAIEAGRTLVMGPCAPRSPQC